MNNIILFLLMTLIYCYSLYAQNLIPNGDFELGPDSSAEGWSLWWDTTCQNPVPVNGPDFWIIVANTPDRLLEDDIIGCWYDVDTAQSGRAWVDFAYGEAGKITLFSPIEKDSLYRLTCYFSWETYSGNAIQPIRAEFRFNNGGDSIKTPPPIKQWQYFDTLFVASANSTELEIWGNEPADFWSAIKIDNLSLKKISSTIINSFQNIKNKILIFPNPASDKFTIKTTACKFNLEIYNSIGLKVEEYQNLSSGEINISNYPVGIYFVKSHFSNQIYIQKLNIIY